MNLMNSVLTFNVLEHEFYPMILKPEISTHFNYVVIKSCEEISLIAISEITEYIERISEVYDFEWHFEVDIEIPQGQTKAYLYPTVV